MSYVDDYLCTSMSLSRLPTPRTPSRCTPHSTAIYIYRQPPHLAPRSVSLVAHTHCWKASLTSPWNSGHMHVQPRTKDSGTPPAHGGHAARRRRADRAAAHAYMRPRAATVRAVERSARGGRGPISPALGPSSVSRLCVERRMAAEAGGHRRRQAGRASWKRRAIVRVVVFLAISPSLPGLLPTAQ